VATDLCGGREIAPLPLYVVGESSQLRLQLLQLRLLVTKARRLSRK
jgi:hypothetical protein